MKYYSVSCIIVQLDDDGEIVDDGYDNDFEFELALDSDGSPVRFLLDTLHPLPETSDFCT